jgi:hypothetical protein
MRLSVYEVERGVGYEVERLSILHAFHPKKRACSH